MSLEAVPSFLSLVPGRRSISWHGQRPWVPTWLVGVGDSISSSVHWVLIRAIPRSFWFVAWLLQSIKQYISHSSQEEMFDSSLEDFLFHSVIQRCFVQVYYTIFVIFFLLELHFFDQFASLKASTNLCSHPAKPKAERAVGKFWWTSFESSSPISHLTWYNAQFSSVLLLVLRTKGNSRGKCQGMNVLCPIALRSSCHTPERELWYIKSDFTS